MVGRVKKELPVAQGQRRRGKTVAPAAKAAKAATAVEEAAAPAGTPWVLPQNTLILQMRQASP
jgi:hypothetical protein